MSEDSSASAKVTQPLRLPLACCCPITDGAHFPWQELFCRCWKWTLALLWILQNAFAGLQVRGGQRGSALPSPLVKLRELALGHRGAAGRAGLGLHCHLVAPATIPTQKPDPQPRAALRTRGGAPCTPFGGNPTTPTWFSCSVGFFPP